jgi:WD40 repeat protein
VAICGDLIAAICYTKGLTLWDFKQNKQSSVLTGHTDLVDTVAFNSNAEIVVSGSRDKTVRVWSAKKLKLMFKLTGSTHGIHEVKLTKDDQYIFSGSAGEVRVWTLQKKALACYWASLEDGEEWFVKYPEIRRLASRFIC